MGLRYECTAELVDYIYRAQVEVLPIF
jgi:hypothetical protein